MLASAMPRSGAAAAPVRCGWSGPRWWSTSPPGKSGTVTPRVRSSTARPTCGAGTGALRSVPPAARSTRGMPGIWSCAVWPAARASRSRSRIIRARSPRSPRRRSGRCTGYGRRVPAGHAATGLSAPTVGHCGATPATTRATGGSAPRCARTATTTPATWCGSGTPLSCGAGSRSPAARPGPDVRDVGQGVSGAVQGLLLQGGGVPGPRADSPARADPARRAPEGPDGPGPDLPLGTSDLEAAIRTAACCCPSFMLPMTPSLVLPMTRCATAPSAVGGRGRWSAG